MDLGAAYRDGIRFFTHKATESTDVQHVHYGDAMNRARAAGIPFLGAYHVVRSGDVAGEVQYFLAYLDAKTPWWRTFPGWFFQIDLEKWSYDDVPAAAGQAFGAVLGREAGHVSLLYASQGQYGNSLGGSLPLWNANYGYNPVAHYREAYPGDTGVGWSEYSGRVPRIWQFGSNLKIGSQPNCDANAFRGTAEDFARMIGAPTVGNADNWAQAYSQGIASWTTDNGTKLSNEPVKWRVSDEAWQKATTSALASQGAQITALAGAVASLSAAMPGAETVTKEEILAQLDTTLRQVLEAGAVPANTPGPAVAS